MEVEKKVKEMKEPVPSINSNYFEPRLIRNKALDGTLTELAHLKETK